MLTLVGVFGWLTGQQHRPVNGDDLAITVLFDHICVQRNQVHGDLSLLSPPVGKL